MGEELNAKEAYNNNIVQSTFKTEEEMLNLIQKWTKTTIPLSFHKDAMKAVKVRIHADLI